MQFAVTDAFIAELRTNILKKKTTDITKMIEPLFTSENNAKLGELLKHEDKHGKSFLYLFAQRTTLKQTTLLFDHFVEQAKNASMLAQAFLHRDAKGNSKGHFVVITGNSAAVTKIVEEGAIAQEALMSKNTDGNTMLHLTAD